MWLKCVHNWNVGNSYLHDGNYIIYYETNPIKTTKCKQIL